MGKVILKLEFGPKAQTPEIPYASSGHPPLNAK
jgi:hypothetical protein